MCSIFGWTTIQTLLLWTQFIWFGSFCIEHFIGAWRLGRPLIVIRCIRQIAAVRGGRHRVRRLRKSRFACVVITCAIWQILRTRPDQLIDDFQFALKIWSNRWLNHVYSLLVGGQQCGCCYFRIELICFVCVLKILRWCCGAANRIIRCFKIIL